MLTLFLCHLQTAYGLLHLNSESYKHSNRSGHTKHYSIGCFSGKYTALRGKSSESG